MAEIELKTIETVSNQPFRKLVTTIGELPSAFIESMSYYEMLAWMVNWLENTVIPAVNNNAEAVEELQGLFVDLKTFVDNYFENLDVQEEINNKLDQMAEDGTLERLIGEYIQASYKIIMPKNFIEADAGDIILLKVKDKSILIDTHYDAALSQVKLFLERNEINVLDYVILTHYHTDHVGNFIDLCNLGFITANTKIYLPAYSPLITQSEQTQNNYTAINHYISANNLDAVIPNIGDSINIDEFRLTFYNCNTDLFTEMGVTEYNDCSTICLTEFGNQKALFTSDITDKPFTYFVDNQIFNEKINIYKIEHHGNNIDNQDTVFLQQIMPDLCLHQTTSYSISIGRNSRSTGLAFMMEKNIPIFSQYNNDNDVIVDVYKDYYSIVQGKQNYAQSGYSIINNYFVDASTTNNIQNGTQSYPFKSLAQALGKISKMPYCRNIIKIADGTYDFPTRQIVSSADIAITGNTTTPSNVVINGELMFYSSDIEITGVKITNNTKYDGCEFRNCRVLINNCIIDSGSDTVSNKQGVICYKSNVTVRQSTISNWSTGLYCQYCVTYTNSVTFSNCTTAISENRGIFGRMSNIYNSVTNELSNSTSLEVLYDITSKMIYSGSVTTTPSTTFDLTSNFSNFNRLIFNVGNVSDGTWESIVVNCYNNVNFVNGQKFVIKTVSGSFVVSTSNAKTLTIDSNNNNTQNIRQVIGIKQ